MAWSSVGSLGKRENVGGGLSVVIVLERSADVEKPGDFRYVEENERGTRAGVLELAAIKREGGGKLVYTL